MVGRLPARRIRSPTVGSVFLRHHRGAQRHCPRPRRHAAGIAQRPGLTPGYDPRRPLLCCRQYLLDGVEHAGSSARGGRIRGCLRRLTQNQRPRPPIRVIAATNTTRFAVGAPYLSLVERSGISPAEHWDLTGLKSILSTAAPLPESTWRWVHEHVNPAVRLGSDSVAPTSVRVHWHQPAGAHPPGRITRTNARGGRKIPTTTATKSSMRSVNS